jgi:DNA-binding SARP family transcriptional activator
MRESPPLRLQLLGPASWSVGGARAVPLERRDAALLAYLAMEGQAPRATLLELLWPDVQREAARNHLRQRLYRLRRAVGVELVEGSELLALAAGIDVDLRDADASSSTASELLGGSTTAIFRSSMPG